MLSCKDKLSKHQHGMQRAQCQKGTNKKTSTYQRLKNQPLNLQHSFHFPAKIGLSKCHLVAKNSRGEQLKNMNEVCFKDNGTRLLLVFPSSLKEPVISEELWMWIRRGNNIQEKVLNFSWSLPCLSFTVPMWSVTSHAANRASINIPSLGLSGHCKSFMPHLFFVVTLLSFYCRHNDRREKMRKAWVWPSTLLWLLNHQLILLQLVFLNVILFFLWEILTYCISLVGRRWKITVHKALQTVVLFHKYILISNIKTFTIN